MPPTFLLLLLAVLLALVFAALSPLVLAGLLMAMLSARLRRTARRVLALALPAAALVGALCGLAGLRTVGLLGPADGPFVVAGAVFTAWVFAHLAWLLWRERRRRRDGILNPLRPPIPGGQ